MSCDNFENSGQFRHKIPLAITPSQREAGWAGWFFQPVTLEILKI